jgi:hypothetical protein
VRIYANCVLNFEIKIFQNFLIGAAGAIHVHMSLQYTKCFTRYPKRTFKTNAYPFHVNEINFNKLIFEFFKKLLYDLPYKSNLNVVFIISEKYKYLMLQPYLRYQLIVIDSCLFCEVFWSI